MKPHCSNFCGGNFQDWLEVMLIDKCNGNCSWCIEKEGYKPKEHVSWQEIADAALKTGKTNIILLGGEPTLYPDMKDLVVKFVSWKKNVYITTNGFLLSPFYVKTKLWGIAGVNISIHHYDLIKNKAITGVTLSEPVLKESIAAIQNFGGSVRLNCNTIKGYIDSKEEAYKYLEFAKCLGVSKVRFAELKLDEGNFVDLHEIMGGEYGLNTDPFTFGCNKDCYINGVHVNFRQMCGLQTPARPTPVDPEQCDKQVLYYDGVIYDGWQRKGIEEEMDNKSKRLLVEEYSKIIIDTMDSYHKGATTRTLLEQNIQTYLTYMIERATLPQETRNDGGCRY